MSVVSGTLIVALEQGPVCVTVVSKNRIPAVDTSSTNVTDVMGEDCVLVTVIVPNVKDGDGPIVAA